MGPNLDPLKYGIIIAAYIFTFFSLSDARFSEQILYVKSPKQHSSLITKLLVKPEVTNQMNIKSTLNPTNVELVGIRSPLSLPPFESLATLPLPDNVSPCCAHPPFSPQSPSTTLPSPTSRTLSPPPSPYTPNFPVHSPPPSPRNIFTSPPMYFPTPNPPQFEPGPPHYGPSPPKQVPSPPFYRPPVVSPPPPPHKKPQFAVWCVAKPTVPDAIIQEALDYACGSGADCKSIQPNGPCFQPDTVLAHASYAFNSYWQKTKVGGGTCDFGGTAMLITIDPSFNDCYFIYN